MSGVNFGISQADDEFSRIVESFPKLEFCPWPRQKLMLELPSMNHSTHSSLTNRILLDINARASIKYDHVDNRDVESGRRKIAVEMPALKIAMDISYQSGRRKGRKFCSRF